MTQRGGYRGGVKPRLPEDKKRASLSCRVAPETRAWLLIQRGNSYQSIGELVDSAVEMLDRATKQDVCDEQ